MIKLVNMFYSFQGEGKTIGQPRLFIRLAGCNLRCKWCDTKYSWDVNSGLTLDNTMKKMLVKYKKWTITGGEPLLQQDEIIKLINEYKPVWVEVETNGSIKPKDDLISKINLWNISPKPSYSQISGKTLEPRILELTNILKDYIVKFVWSYNSLLKDIEFTKRITGVYGIQKNKVYIMPEGGTREDLLSNTKKLWNIIKEYNYNLSTRLHIFAYSDRIGV